MVQSTHVDIIFNLIFGWDFTLSGNKYLNFVYDNTICEMWRPHLVIYLDAPVEFVRQQIYQREDVRCFV